MHSQIALLVLSLVAYGCAAPVSDEEGKSLVQDQARMNYDNHQKVIEGKKDVSSDDNGFAVTFDNGDVKHRDRGYGFEKVYAYSRETADFDFVDDVGALNAKDIVEKYGATNHDAGSGKQGN